MVHVLQAVISKDDSDPWKFSVPLAILNGPRRRKPGVVYGKAIQFTPTGIIFQMEEFKMNRILNGDDPAKFISLSFGSLRFPDSTLNDTAEYIFKHLQAGLWFNGVQYRFYHHSNSQLRGRSCFVREAETDQELDTRIYKLGDFGRINNAAKRAKRIGLLFSSGEIDYQLDPRRIADIPDIKVGDELFSDGCGLISRALSINLSRAKRIIFREKRYVPCVFQIRYRGYKGVLMLHPDLDKTKAHLAQFRASMKKFSATEDRTFSVVNYSKPYTFGRLNNDIIVLLNSLGVSNEKILAKQHEYFTWVANASTDPAHAFDFLFSSSREALARRVLTDGLDHQDVIRDIRAAQLKELGGAENKDNDEKFKSRMIILKSRRLFGVCDPYQVLKEGEVHIRITTARTGPSTPVHGDVLVVRNPCLHPGDCLKLRATRHEKLDHLVDCIVFSSVAKPGHHSGPSMSSGGDLDGDEYFVCWDPDLVQPYVMESYDYPGNKEATMPNLRREHLARYFAFYNNASVARVSALHHKWLKAKGATSRECQELNALHSQSVDGARIRIPEPLLNPPKTQEAEDAFILNQLKKAAAEFLATFSGTTLRESLPPISSSEEARSVLLQLLHSDQQSLSEYELFDIALKLSRKYGIDLRPFLVHFNYGALTTPQKYAVSAALGLSRIDEPGLWNSLFRSDILTRRDLYQRSLDQPFSLQRLYSSKFQGLATFFDYLKMATQEFTRKLIIIKPDTENRFAIGIFIRGDIPWDEILDPAVHGNVVVCSFMPQAAGFPAPQRLCTPGYRLHLGNGRLQLYNGTTQGTFVFISRPARAPGKEINADVIISVALNIISQQVRNQLGKVQRAPVTDIELHVVSNRDRIAHHLFDLWFEHVPTEKKIRRFEREPRSYERNSLTSIQWSEDSPWLKDMFTPQSQGLWTREALVSRSLKEIDSLMSLCLQYHIDDKLFAAFESLLFRESPPQDLIRSNMEKYPGLAFALLKTCPPDDDGLLPQRCFSMKEDVIQNLVRAANQQGMAVLVALEKLTATIHTLPSDIFISILFLAPTCIRSKQLVQEVLLVLAEQRLLSAVDSPTQKYAHKHALGVAFDRAEEAADTCPCDENGKPRRQRNPPLQATLSLVPDHPSQVRARIRVDARSGVRLHSHVRVQAASHPDKGPEWIEALVMDGLVTRASSGELYIELLYPAPPELEVMDWNIYDAGSIATAQAMIDALTRLVREGYECCGYQNIITGEANGDTPIEAHQIQLSDFENETLNESQREAVLSCDNAALSLIWGPPGTGKTTVVVQILRRMLQDSGDEFKVLMTASTHNAVDNVLERFIEVNREHRILSNDQLLRVATDNSKVNPALQSFTINARVGGDMNENNKLFKAAKKRLDQAKVVFTTCAGSGLGILRKAEFDVALIDEASQVTEPCALIPLVKGTRKAILVGDHVQLRPTVQRMGKALEYDVSLMERLYTKVEAQDLTKAMLKIQYRFPQELAEFPSQQFYNGELRSGIQDTASVLRVLSYSKFPWPLEESNGVVKPAVFVHCGEEEEMGGRTGSKQNVGQAHLVKHILELLRAPSEREPPLTEEEQAESKALKITVLSPYTAQRQLIDNQIRQLDASCSTVDSFQGRESDIIVFSSVRSNPSHEVGFLEDERRLNVMWTRARKALIIVGDRETLKEGSVLWKRAIESCCPVVITPPDR